MADFGEQQTCFLPNAVVPGPTSSDGDIAKLPLECVVSKVEL